MTERQRFNATMRYQPRDRCPLVDFSFWPETIDEWRSQGLPDDVILESTNAWFGLDSLGDWVPVGVGLHPGFEYKVIEDRGDHEVVRDWEGVMILRKKHLGSIPMHLGHTLVDRESWEKEFIPKLDPSTPERFPADWKGILPRYSNPDSEFPVVLPGGSLYGWIRNWMGVEAVSYLVYDDPMLFEEMVETICVLQVEMLTKILESGVKADVCAMWEDMCYSAGPLLTPELFKSILVPRYKRIRAVLDRFGVEVCWIDCDGKIDALIPHWLDAGINCMFPIEVGTWGADPVAMRKEYGRDLLLMGGFGKVILSRSKEAIDREIERLTPLVQEGGFIPMPDHRVPPDVPYDHYLHYVERIREVWGKSTNLATSPALDARTKV